MIIGIRKTFSGFIEIEKTKIKPVKFLLEVEIEGEIKPDGEILSKNHFSSLVSTVITKCQNTIIEDFCHRNTLEIFTKKIWDFLIIEIARYIKHGLISKVHLHRVFLKQSNYYVEIKRATEHEETKKSLE